MSVKADLVTWMLVESVMYRPIIPVWGTSIYDVRKNFGGFDPLPPCHCHKSADFFPFVCFFLTPFPSRALTSYMEAPLRELAVSDDCIVCRHHPHCTLTAPVVAVHSPTGSVLENDSLKLEIWGPIQ